jgi:DHA1 family inner membrane transport protein
LTSEANSLRKEKWYVFILAAIQFAHIVDFVVLMPLGPVLMRELGISPIKFATLVSSYNFSATASALTYGFFADRFDRKKSLIICFIGFIIGTLTCGLAPNFGWLLTARIVAGAFGGILNSVVMAIVSDLIPYVRRGKAMSVIMSAFSVSSIIGVPMGLAIADIWGWQSTFYFIAFFSIFILIPTVTIIPKLGDHIEVLDFKTNLKRFADVLTKESYIKSYGLIFIINITAFLIIPFLSPYAVKNVGILETELKYLYLVGGIVTVFTARLFGVLTDRVGAIKLYGVLTLLSTIPIYLYTNADPMQLTWFLALSALFMSLVSGRIIPAWTMITAIPETKDRGTFMGLMNSIRSFGSAAASLIGGAMIIETSDGLISGFETVGYLSIFLTITTVFMAIHIYHLVKDKLEHEKTIKS